MDRELWNQCVEFHGHECPGLAIGFRASEIAMERMGLSFSEDEEIVCITENNACGVDAVQWITSCTVGKGNLIFKDRGKMAFSFINRKNGQALRLVLKPGGKEMERAERQTYILTGPVEELFKVEEVEIELPEKARMFETLICDVCGEGAAEHRMRIQEGKTVCLDCLDDYSRGW